MINKLWALIWYAHIGSSLLDPRFSIKYIGRYTQRAVLAEYRITYYDGKIVRFSFKDYAQGGKTNYMTLKVNTFVGRLIRHIPDKYFPMVRYAGIFSNRWKGRYLPQARTALQQPEPMPELESNSPAWVVRQQEYSGTNPLQCPNCHQLLVLVVVLFGPWPRIQRTFRDSGRDAAIPSPLMRPG